MEGDSIVSFVIVKFMKYIIIKKDTIFDVLVKEVLVDSA